MRKTAILLTVLSLSSCVNVALLDSSRGYYRLSKPRLLQSVSSDPTLSPEERLVIQDAVEQHGRTLEAAEALR
jgi:hypothetical protein